MPDTPKPNGWDQYSRLVLNELKQLNDGQDALRVEVGGMKIQFVEDLGRVHTEISLLKQAATIRGLIGGAVPGALAAIAALVWFILKGG